MKQGIHLHPIVNDDFTTNLISFFFTTPLREETIAARTLLTNLMDSVNLDFPTPQLFKKKLAELYGTRLSTRVHKKGHYHIIECSISYLKKEYLPENVDLFEDICYLLKSILYSNLTNYDDKNVNYFEIEKENLINYIDSLSEDSFYCADQALDQLFFGKSLLALPKISNKDQVEKLTESDISNALKNMLTEDQVDIYLHGTFEKDQVEAIGRIFNFTKRLDLKRNQSFESQTLQVETQSSVFSQSILELGYLLPEYRTPSEKAVLVVFNALLGGGAQSILFQSVREKEGLAYTIGSEINLLSRQLRVYAGISNSAKNLVQEAIEKEIKKIAEGEIDLAQLEQTKMMIEREISSLPQHPNALIDRMQTLTLDVRNIDDVDYQQSIHHVTVEQLQEIANKIQLRAVYFLEGEK